MANEVAKGPAPWRVLVVANRTCPCPELLDEVSARAGEAGEVFLVAPALNSSRIAHWVSDTDEAVVEARARLDEATAGLAERGVHARPEVGDADPFRALEDAVHVHAPQEIVIATLPPGESHWLEHEFVDRVRARYGLPVAHVVSRYGLDSV